MNVYISYQKVKSCVEYFRDYSVNSPEQLGLFFFFKSLGINSRTYIPFQKAGQMSNEQKTDYNLKLFQLSSMFTYSEFGGKKSCLFPFSIQRGLMQKHFYNGGSEFKQLLSRITDTIDNTLVDKFIDKDSTDSIKLKRDYLNYLQSACLNNSKISLFYFSIWINRFISFEIDENCTKEEFTRVCTKNTIEFLNLTEKEMESLFDSNVGSQLIDYDVSEMSGERYRELFDFIDAPEVKYSSSDVNNYHKIKLDQIEVRRLIEMNDKNPSIEELKVVLGFKKQVIIFGVPGVGKSRLISEIEKDYDDVTKIQFHPSTTYEEFIGGSTIINGDIVVEAGIFLRKCKEAELNTNKRFLFVIDEINRGNISKIFGEVILALDREYCVDLTKSINLNNNLVTNIRIPSNLFILATMNSADRSIAVLDFAIRRRFAFVKMFPNYEIIKEHSDTSSIGIDLAKLLKTLNSSIIDILGDENLILGHSYFLPTHLDEKEGKKIWTIRDLRIVFNYTILPMLEEYTFGNKNDLYRILGESISSQIYNDEEFVNELKKIFSESVM